MKQINFNIVYLYLYFFKKLLICQSVKVVNIISLNVFCMAYLTGIITWVRLTITLVHIKSSLKELSFYIYKEDSLK